jgi:phage/plasmid-associated DNA primase
MDETKVKQLTGGDRLKARFMRQDFFEFYPTHKIFLAANHKPIVRGTDYAIWRRIKLVPFEVTIPEKERIPFAKMLAMLKAEWPGILAWAVQGCIKWQAQGLGTPTEVTKATQAYREEMDIIGDFIDEHCIIDANAKAKASTLYATYKTWCDANGEHALTQKVFGSRLTERGFERKREKAGYFWLGIGILENLVNDPNDGSPSQETNGGAVFNEHERRKVNHDEPFSGINENNCISPGLIPKNGSPSFTQTADDNHEASSSKGFDEVNDRSSSDEREVFII